MLKNILKLRKMILQLAEVATDKAVLIYENELAEGVEVFVEQEGEFVPAPDGEYEAEDKFIVVAEGKVAEIRVKEAPAPEEEPEEVKEETPEEPTEDERIAEMQAKLDELNALLAERDARIAELEALLAEKDAEITAQKELLNMSSDKPAKEVVKKASEGALKYFN